MPGLDTKRRILDAAERLFAEKGFAGASLRNVTTEAGVNLAAVHYHFGTKEALLQAVFSRRIDPVNRERLRRLDLIEQASDKQPPALEPILDAFLGPVMDLKRDLAGQAPVWSRFIGRVYSEPVDLVQTLIRDQFTEVAQRFVRAIHRALPELPPAEIYQRLQFTVGMMTHSLTGLNRIALLPEYRTESVDGDESLQRMIAFLSAGFRASPTKAAARDVGAGHSRKAEVT